MISFIKLVQDHKEMVSYFHSRISARGLGLICDHIKKEDTQGSNYLLDETERTEKLAALNTEVMKIISADFATVVSRRGVVDKYFASVSEYPHDLPIAVFPEPFLPASIKASNKFRVLSCLVIYSLYLMLQWRLHTRTKLDKPLIFDQFSDYITAKRTGGGSSSDTNTSPVWKLIINESSNKETHRHSKESHHKLTLDFLRGCRGDDASEDSNFFQPPSKVQKLSTTSTSDLVPPAECNTDILPLGGKPFSFQQKLCSLPPPTATVSSLAIALHPVSLGFIDTRSGCGGGRMNVSDMTSPSKYATSIRACPLCQRQITFGITLRECKNKKHPFCRDCVLTALDFSSQTSLGPYKVFCPECGVSSDVTYKECLNIKSDTKSPTGSRDDVDTLLDSWSSIKDSLCAVSEVLSSRVEGLDSRLQEARTEIADTFATLTGEFSAIIEAKRSKAIDVVNTLEKNLRSAFAELSHITRDVEEKTAALAAFYAKARDVRCPRGQRRVAAKKARETLRYLEVCYEPLLRTPLPSLSSDEAALAVSSFQPVVSLGASLKNFSEHIKEYASLVEV